MELGQRLIGPCTQSLVVNIWSSQSTRAQALLLDVAQDSNNVPYGKNIYHNSMLQHVRDILFDLKNIKFKTRSKYIIVTTRNIINEYVWPIFSHSKSTDNMCWEWSDPCFPSINNPWYHFRCGSNCTLHTRRRLLSALQNWTPSPFLRYNLPSIQGMNTHSN